MANKDERIKQLLSIMKKNTAVSIRDLTEVLGVSEMTVRRDLNDLETKGVVTLLHGGAVLNKENYFDSYEKPYQLAAEGARHLEEKKKIGRAAAALIAENETLIIDSGSTTEWLARSIPDTLPLRCLCWAMNILMELHRKDQATVTFAGGELHRNTLMFESPEGLSLIRRYRGTKAFFSAGGIHPELGVTSATSYETEAKQAALASSLKKVLLADSSKFGQVSASYYADLGSFSTIITDSAITSEYRNIIESLGIELIIA
ncbi:MAG: DeoR/GlpR family DNA-binding transcription regulator [Spirochaetia bacterium]